jgi:hypothetical protein
MRMFTREYVEINRKNVSRFSWDTSAGQLYDIEI